MLNLYRFLSFIPYFKVRLDVENLKILVKSVLNSIDKNLFIKSTEVKFFDKKTKEIEFLFSKFGKGDYMKMSFKIKSKEEIDNNKNSKDKKDKSNDLLNQQIKKEINKIDKNINIYDYDIDYSFIKLKKSNNDISYDIIFVSKFEHRLKEKSNKGEFNFKNKKERLLISDELLKLEKLKNDGILSNSEFKNAKEKLLKGKSAFYINFD